MMTSLNTITSTLSFDLIKNFTTVSLVCMFNSKNIDICYSVFKQSCKILELNPRDIEYFKTVCKRIENSATKIKTTLWSEFMYWNLENFRLVWIEYFPQHKPHIDKGLEEIRGKIKLANNETYWSTLDSSYIWQWIHIISIDIDLNCGLTAKIGFLIFIQNLISCGNCLKHYKQNLNNVIDSLNITTCSNTLLALHTFINMHSQQEQMPDYIYNSKLVNLYFYSKYKGEYLHLKTIS